MSFIPTIMIGRESAENIAELIEAHSQSSYMRNLAMDIRKIVKALEDTGGWVVIGGERYKQERKKWTPEEEDLFAAKIRLHQGWGGWKIPGNQKKVWEEMSVDFGRPPTSLKSKYAQLLRRGIIKDVGE